MISGLWALAAAFLSRNASMQFLRIFGTLYFLDGVMGVFTGSGYLDLEHLHRRRSQHAGVDQDPGRACRISSRRLRHRGGLVAMVGARRGEPDGMKRLRRCLVRLVAALIVIAVLIAIPIVTVERSCVATPVSRPQASLVFDIPDATIGAPKATVS